MCSFHWHRRICLPIISATHIGRKGCVIFPYSASSPYLPRFHWPDHHHTVASGRYLRRVLAGIRVTRIETIQTAGLHESVGIHGPVTLLPIVGNGLDQVAVRGAHTHPKGGDGIGRPSTGPLWQDKGRSSFADKRVRCDRARAQCGTHGGVHRGDADSGKSRQDLVARIHGGGSMFRVLLVGSAVRVAGRTKDDQPDKDRTLFITPYSCLTLEQRIPLITMLERHCSTFSTSRGLSRGDVSCRRLRKIWLFGIIPRLPADGIWHPETKPGI